MKKECGTCQKCCDGTYTGNINGHIMGNGVPCFFLSSGGCTIYKDRPQKPCVEYQCLWLEIDSVPDFMKPEVSGVITDLRTTLDGQEYLMVTDGDNIKVLSYAMDFAASRNIPVAVMNTKTNYINVLGDPELCKKVVAALDEQDQTF